MSVKLGVQYCLQEGLINLGITSSAQQQDCLGEFLLLLDKWNKVHNLTAVRDIMEMVSKHLLDSLVVAPFLIGSRVIDVGSGAGLPGIPLSIICPEIEFTLLDSSSKRTSFITFVIATLKLSNVKVVHSPVERYKDERGFNVVLSRAFSDLGKFISASFHLCHRDGFFLAMKGKVVQAKNEPLPDGYLLTKIEAVKIPGIDGERCLVFVSKKAN